MNFFTRIGARRQIRRPSPNDRRGPGGAAMSPFDRLLRNTDQAFFLSDPDRSGWRFQNDVLAGVCGITPEAMARHPDFLVTRIVEEDRDLFVAATERERRLQPADVEFRVRRADQTIRWLRMRTMPFRGEDGSVQVSGSLDDISGRKALEQERLARVVADADLRIREMHHAIMNDLHGVAGLLEHASRSRQELDSDLVGIARQVQMISLVHGLQTRSPAGMVVVDLARGIADYLSSTSSQAFSFETAEPDLRRVVLVQRECVPVAIALGELGANAMKHGLGRCGMTLTFTPSNSIVIEIWNSGQLPIGLDLTRTETLPSGLGMVVALLPRRGAKLSFQQESAIVTATLTLDAPAVALA